MFKPGFYLGTIFSTILFGITFTHTKHILYATTSEEPSFFVFAGVFSFLFFETSADISSSILINGDNKSDKHRSKQQIHNIIAPTLSLTTIGIFDRNKVSRLFPHFPLDKI